MSSIRENNILYKGNSAAHWYAKATAYSHTLQQLWRIPEIRRHMNGETHIVDAVVRALAENNSKEHI